MREIDQVRAYIPPISLVPGSTTTPGGGGGVQIGSGAVGTDYDITKDGWVMELNDPGPLSGSSKTSGSYYSLYGVHRSVFEWVPFARQDMALVPLGQDVAEGKNFEAFHSEYAAETISGAVFPGWNGVVCNVIDMWSSEKIELKMIENIGWNQFMPGAIPSYPGDVYSVLNMPQNNPSGIEHKLRLDQVISARYRQMVSTNTAPTSQFFGGQLMTIADTTIGGNASISDQIHHVRWVYMVASNNGDNNIANPAGGGAATYNYAKVGFFIPSALDTLTIGIQKIESDAEWATLARRGASR